MVQALIELGERQDRIITIVKGKYGFKNKSDAINHIIAQYERTTLEPTLRPDYLERLD